MKERKINRTKRPIMILLKWEANVACLMMFQICVLRMCGHITTASRKKQKNIIDSGNISVRQFIASWWWLINDKVGQMHISFFFFLVSLFRPVTLLFAISWSVFFRPSMTTQSSQFCTVYGARRKLHSAHRFWNWDSFFFLVNLMKYHKRTRTPAYLETYEHKHALIFMFAIWENV